MQIIHLSFLVTNLYYQVESQVLKTMPVTEVDSNDPYLFIHQMESAVMSCDDNSVQMLGLDEMTTCCSAIVRHTGSFALAAGHFDGNDTMAGLQRMLSGVQKLTSDWARRNNLTDLSIYEYEVHLIGGFDDARNISVDVAMQLLENLNHHPLHMHLKTACICSHNTYYQDNIPYPCITGLICYVRTGLIAPASFTYQGPLEEVRRLRFAMRPPIIMHSVYDPYNQIVEIKPYDWTLTDDTIVQLLGLNTNSFLHYWSTSPLAEKPSFVPSCKVALRFLRDNRQSLFSHGKSYKFARIDGVWKLLDS